MILYGSIGCLKASFANAINSEAVETNFNWSSLICSNRSGLQAHENIKANRFLINILPVQFIYTLVGTSI